MRTHRIFEIKYKKIHKFFYPIEATVQKLIVNFHVFQKLCVWNINFDYFYINKDLYSLNLRSGSVQETYEVCPEKVQPC